MRPTGQIGLDSYPAESEPSRMIGEAPVIAAETLVQTIHEDVSFPEGDGVIVSIDSGEEKSAL